MCFKMEKKIVYRTPHLKKYNKNFSTFLNLFILENPIQYPLNDKSYTLLNPHNAQFKIETTV